MVSGCAWLCDGTMHVTAVCKYTVFAYMCMYMSSVLVYLRACSNSKYEVKRACIRYMFVMFFYR